MKENFNLFYATTRKIECGNNPRNPNGNVDDPRDPGGRTSRGITQRVYSAYRVHKGLPSLDVYLMGEDECAEIYKVQYWDPVRGDDLPSGVDLAMGDYSVNSGPVRAIKSLQSCLGVRVDGQIGLVTLRACAAVNDRRSLIKSLCTKRLSFLEQLRAWRFFNKGWKSRVASIELQADAIA